MYVHKLILKKTKFMNKMIMNRLTMLAVTLMASIACFAQGNGKMATSLINQPHAQGDIVDLYELRYYIVAVEGDILSLEVIGFASDITGTVGAVYGDAGNPDKVTDLYEGVLEIPSNYPASEVGFKCQITSIAENAFTATTCRNDDTKYKSKFADAAALVNKILISYDAEFPNAITIGANAFGALTSVTEVENLTPGAKINAIPKSSFAASVFKTASLIVPASEGSFLSYAKTAGWREFCKLYKKGSSIMLGDTNGDRKLTIGDAQNVLTLIAKIKAGTASYNEIYDINGDGKITIADAQDLITKYQKSK